MKEWTIALDDIDWIETSFGALVSPCRAPAAPGAEGLPVRRVPTDLGLESPMPGMNDRIDIRPMQPADPEVVAVAFEQIGWRKPVAQHRKYLEEQDANLRVVLVAWAGARFAGYVTVVWCSEYAPLRADAVPEIPDLNVLPRFRRQGIGSRLLDEAERLAAGRSTEVGIGVGLHPGYNAAAVHQARLRRRRARRDLSQRVHQGGSPAEE